MLLKFKSTRPKRPKRSWMSAKRYGGKGLNYWNTYGQNLHFKMGHHQRSTIFAHFHTPFWELSTCMPVWGRRVWGEERWTPPIPEAQRRIWPWAAGGCQFEDTTNERARLPRGPQPHITDQDKPASPWYCRARQPVSPLPLYNTGQADSHSASIAQDSSSHILHRALVSYCQALRLSYHVSDNVAL